MSDGFTVTTQCDTPDKTVDSRSDAKSAVDTHVALCEDCGDDDVGITAGDGGPEVVAESDPVDTQDDYDLPDDGPSVDEDPLVWMPDEFTDTIDGTVAINRKGFEVLAHHYSIQCETELCESLTNKGRVAFKATATDADGDTYTAFGSASEDRGDERGLFVEMADTRAYKRAVSRATGVGMVAVDELQSGMEAEQ